MGKTRGTRCRWCGQGSPWLVLQSSRTCCRQGPGSSPSPSPGELGGGVFPPSPWSSAPLGAAPRLWAPAGAAAGLTCVAVRERCRGGPVPPASAELQQGELVPSFLPFRSSAPSESPALFLTGEDPGSAARPLVLKDREARACAGGEPRGAAQRRLLRPVGHGDGWSPGQVWLRRDSAGERARRRGACAGQGAAAAPRGAALLSG